MAVIERIVIILTAWLVMLVLPIAATATVLWSSSAESRTCDTALGTNNTSTSTFDGATWSFTNAENPAFYGYPFAWVRCLSSTPSIQTPYGDNYVEWLTKCDHALTGGRCAPGNDPDTGTTYALTDMEISGLSNLSMGTTYYLGATWRFDRVNDHNVWQDGPGDDSFDKLMEFRYTGGRWIVDVGRDGGFNGDYTGRYIYSFGAATATECPQCGGNTGVGWGSSSDPCYWDRKMHNASGYNVDSPRVADYGHWYNVVMAITLSTNSAVGTAKLYVNGELVSDCSGQTAATGTASSTPFVEVSMHGTIAQPAYDAPPHYRRVDNMMFATELTDVQNAGLMDDPEAGGGGNITMFIQQGLAYLMMFWQVAFICGYFWEQRAKAVQLLVAIHVWYWGVRYRLALRRWQRNAPVMLEHRGETIELGKESDAWQLRK